MNNIASERVRMRLSQGDLAEEMGVSRDVVRAWESEKTKMKVQDAIQLCDLFGCSLDYLMGRTDARLPYAVLIA